MQYGVKKYTSFSIKTESRDSTQGRFHTYITRHHAFPVTPTVPPRAARQAIWPDQLLTLIAATKVISNP